MARKGGRRGNGLQISIGYGKGEDGRGKVEKRRGED